MILHINEAYEHEPILPYQGEESCPLNNGCTKTTTQCVDVAARVVLTPTADLGPAVVTCQGNPTVTCVTAPSGTSCTITLTQRICTSIPVRYGVKASDPTSAIACATSGAAPGFCPCGQDAG